MTAVGGGAKVSAPGGNDPERLNEESKEKMKN